MEHVATDCLWRLVMDDSSPSVVILVRFGQIIIIKIVLASYVVVCNVYFVEFCKYYI